MTRIGTLMFASAIVFGSAALAPSGVRAAQTGCAQWDLSGRWQLKQLDGYTVKLDLVQTASTLKTGAIKGTSWHSTPGGGWVYGSINDGVMSENKFSFTVYWKSGGRGWYQGEVKPDGRFWGTMRDLKNPKNYQAWHDETGRKAGCLSPIVETPPSSAETPPASPEKPIRRLGKVTVATAKNDVDVHEGPGGQTNKVQCQGGPCIMRKGTKAKVLEYHADGWCKLDKPVGNVIGWVAEDHLTTGIPPREGCR